jgi:DNA-binding transcriptional regulator GbsR (MarR family)
MNNEKTYRSQFRLPWDLYEALQAQATTNGISLNAELVRRLQTSLSSELSNNDLAMELKRTSEQLSHITELIEKLTNK